MGTRLDAQVTSLPCSDEQGLRRGTQGAIDGGRAAGLFRSRRDSIVARALRQGRTYLVVNGTIVSIALATHRLSLRAADASASVGAAFAACWLAASARDAAK